MRVLWSFLVLKLLKFAYKVPKHFEGLHTLCKSPRGHCICVERYLAWWRGGGTNVENEVAVIIINCIAGFVLFNAMRGCLSSYGAAMHPLLELIFLLFYIGK